VTNPNEKGIGRRAAIRKDQIIAGAADVFFERGFSRTSIDDVIDKVGGSKRTLYKHFSNKEELFVAVVMSVSEEAIQTIDIGNSEDLRKTLVIFGVRYLEMLFSRAGLALFRAVLAEAPHIPQLGEAFLNAAPRRMRQALTELFKQYNRSGTAKITRPHAAAAEFLALVRGELYLDAMVRREVPSAKEIRGSVESAVATFLYGALDRTPASAESSPSSRRHTHAVPVKRTR
jgi:TetR/AcrR family transcriptional regulator, mexJK operon transcriptional repressor